MTLYFDNYTDNAYIKNTDVKLDETGKGIAQLMLSTVMDFLTGDLNVSDITLIADGSEISKHVNAPSRVDEEKHHYDLVKLYEKFGFAVNPRDNIGNEIDDTSTMNYILKKGILHFKA